MAAPAPSPEPLGTIREIFPGSDPTAESALAFDHDGVGDWIPGSDTERVIHHAPCPVPAA